MFTILVYILFSRNKSGNESNIKQLFHKTSYFFIRQAGYFQQLFVIYVLIDRRIQYNRNNIRRQIIKEVSHSFKQIIHQSDTMS